MDRARTRDAQAACDFSFSTSKFSPFFHRVSVRAAILRARVRRTMVGLMPLASELVKLPKRSREHAGPGRRGFEQTLEIVIVIFVQTANGNLLFGPAPFALHVDRFSGDASFQSQSAVLPQLALTAETMRGLDQDHRQSGTNRAQRGNLSQLGGDAMFATLGQKLAARLLAHVLQHVQLLIEVLRSPPRSGFADFF